MSNEPLVSFVVPCFNYGCYVGECIESILSLNGGYSFEIIAINDASTDDSYNKLKSFKSPNVKVLSHSTNQGVVATLNEVFPITRGRFIARIDADDRYHPDFLVKSLPGFDESAVGLVYGNAAMIDDLGNQTASSVSAPHREDFIGEEFVPLLYKNYICSPTVISRREALLGALPIPADAVVEDWYLSLMIARIYKLRYIDQVVADYRVHSSNRHVNDARNRTLEAGVFAILDLVYGLTEASVEADRAKRAIKNRVYAAQFLTAADQYFGIEMDVDFRRCYRRALLAHPASAIRLEYVRRLVGSLMGRRNYELLKRYIKSSFSVSSPGSVE